MQYELTYALGRASRRLRLDTLVRLRWLSVVGQILALVIVHHGLGFQLPLLACGALVVMSIWLNILLRIRYPVSYLLSDRFALGLLAYDVLQLAALLYLTGGLENPFASLFLAPVLISATALSISKTMLLGLLVLILSTSLAFFHLPLPWDKANRLDLPSVYVFGIWSSILLGTGFCAIYAWRVSQEANQLADALAATELVIAREQHLSQLDGLAAAAAHELGTPLATITLVAKELANAVDPESPLGDDIRLLRQEVDRCRDILGKLTSLNEDEGPLATLSLRQLVEEIVSPQRSFEVTIRIDVSGEGTEPVMRRNPSVIYGLGNLIENALDFATTEVTVTGLWNDTHVTLQVLDDGPGFPPEILLRAGEPYLTTRGRGRHAGEGRQGLGLGLFLAKTLLDRSGAQVAFGNVTGTRKGARVDVTWTRDAFEKGVGLLATSGLEEGNAAPHLTPSREIGVV